MNRRTHIRSVDQHTLATAVWLRVRRTIECVTERGVDNEQQNATADGTEWRGLILQPTTY